MRKILLGYSVCEKQSQLLPGTLCKQQKLKLPQAARRCTFLMPIHSVILLKKHAEVSSASSAESFLRSNFSCPAFSAAQQTLLTLRVLHGRSRTAEPFYREMRNNYIL